MLKIFRDESIDAVRRDEMAKAAAPYCHSRLSTIDAKLNVNQSLAMHWTRWRAEGRSIDPRMDSLPLSRFLSGFWDCPIVMLLRAAW